MTSGAKAAGRFGKEDFLYRRGENAYRCPAGETVEHPFGTLKARMGATHFLTRTLPRVPTEMALQVLAYDLTRVLNIMGSKGLRAAIRA